MTTQDNAFTATGTGTREDFLALATQQGGRRPTTGFQTREVNGNNFWARSVALYAVSTVRLASLTRGFPRTSSPAFTGPRVPFPASLGGRQET
jgi:hypothetical protein